MRRGPPYNSKSAVGVDVLGRLLCGTNISYLFDLIELTGEQIKLRPHACGSKTVHMSF
jgi:hypothetical protein